MTTQLSAMEELKPCPFCGNQPTTRRCCSDDAHTYIDCKPCRISISAGINPKARTSVEIWNARDASEWVYCPEQPTRLDDYCVTVRDVDNCLRSTWSQWDGKEWDVLGDGQFVEVIAWMPLPAPAKMEE